MFCWVGCRVSGPHGLSNAETLKASWPETYASKSGTGLLMKPPPCIVFRLGACWPDGEGTGGFKPASGRPRCLTAQGVDGPFGIAQTLLSLGSYCFQGFGRRNVILRMLIVGALHPFSPHVLSKDPGRYSNCWINSCARWERPAITGKWIAHAAKSLEHARGRSADASMTE